MDDLIAPRHFVGEQHDELVIESADLGEPIREWLKPGRERPAAEGGEKRVRGV